MGVRRVGNSIKKKEKYKKNIQVIKCYIVPRLGDVFYTDAVRVRI